MIPRMSVPRRMGRARWAAVIGVMLAGLLPLSAWAQATGLDPAARAVVQYAAVEVGHQVAPGRVARPSQPAPSLPEAEATDEPEEEVAVDLSEVRTYTSSGLTMDAPVAWNVLALGADEAAFIVEIPDTEMAVAVGLTDADFPGLIGVALIRSMGDALAAELGDEVTMEAADTLFSSQGLPVAQLRFSGGSFGEEIGGRFYAFATGSSAYLAIAGGPLDEWLLYADAIETMVGSLTFDDGLIDLAQAGDAPELFVDAEELTEVEIPAGWYVSNTDDPQLPVIVAEPELRYVVAIGSEATFGQELSPELAGLFLSPDGESNPEDYDDLIDAISDALGSSSGGFELDPAMSASFPREGAVMIRLGGMAELDDDLTVPLVFFIDLREAGGVVAIVFGDVEAAQAAEAEIMQLIESVTVLE